MNTHNFICFDLGATSGRTILATIADGTLTLKELTRFPNKIVRVHNGYYWDIFALCDALKDGLRAAATTGATISAIGIDTWGVDFAYVGDDDTLLSQPRSYRDPYTNGAPEELFKIIPREKVYALTGIQIMNFNSAYQLFAAHRAKSAALRAAKHILFMPDALSFLLTGNKVCEYTIASTSQLLNPWKKCIDAEIAKAAGVDTALFAPIVMPGAKVGTLTEAIAQETGISAATPVIAVAGHDTASAVAAVPAENERFAYLSSGTWSLMGIELHEPVVTDDSYRMNFTNEGGVDGTTRFLKNITGMWLLEQCRKEWEAQGTKYDYAEIVAMASNAAPFRSLIDPDAPDFANPASMPAAIAAYCRRTEQPAPDSHAEYIRCIFDSLALKYKYVFKCLEQIAPFRIEKLHVIGGGSQNRLLNQFTANATGVAVLAGPSEATAIGNAMVQAKGLGIVGSLGEMRAIIRKSFAPEAFTPEDGEKWEAAYSRFSGLLCFVPRNSSQ
jgi:rhamnulokinase